MQIKSNHAYLTLLLTTLPLLLVHGANLTLPTLTSCEPAEILISATGNYTIQGRDVATHKLVFHAHIDQGVDHVTWNPVDLPPNSIALISILDQTSPFTTSLTSSQAAIFPNPLGNTSCLARDKDRHRPTEAQKTMVATIIGIVLGAFFLLILLLLAGMMYRRKKERAVKEQDDCLDHSCAGEQVIAGGSYMQRLVPGLSLQDAKPLPRDRGTEREQLDWASTRRANRHCKENAGGGEEEAEAGLNCRTTTQRREPGGMRMVQEEERGPEIRLQVTLTHPTTPLNSSNNNTKSTKEPNEIGPKTVS
ncbi:hypothetical protein NDA13_003620 [Ustilago tritici]|nr:hypothetical protein NDA13_003620 [Ustilago tritici]